MSRPGSVAAFPGRRPWKCCGSSAGCARGHSCSGRVSAPRLERTGGDGEGLMTGAQHIHSLMHVRRDLRQGMVVVGVRFHDSRTADNLLLSGNVVGFTHRGPALSGGCRGRDQPRSKPTEQGHMLTLRHSSELSFSRRSAAQRLGRISYDYTIDARSMLFGVEVMLEVDPGADVADVELTIGHDHLSHGLNDVRYNTVAVEMPGAARGQLRARRRPGPAPFAAAGASLLFDRAGRDRRLRAGDPYRAAAARAAGRAGGAGRAARQAASGAGVLPFSRAVPRRAPRRSARTSC